MSGGEKRGNLSHQLNQKEEKKDANLDGEESLHASTGEREDPLLWGERAPRSCCTVAPTTTLTRVGGKKRTKEKGLLVAEGEKGGARPGEASVWLGGARRGEEGEPKLLFQRDRKREGCVHKKTGECEDRKKQRLRRQTRSSPGAKNGARLSGRKRLADWEKKGEKRGTALRPGQEGHGGYEPWKRICRSHEKNKRKGKKDFCLVSRQFVAYLGRKDQRESQ